MIARNAALVCLLLGSLPTPRVLAPWEYRGNGPFRVGGAVRRPVVLSRVEPVPTPEAKAARISGLVLVEVVIDRAGKVAKAEVVKPLPFGLDHAALDAVKQWRFRPGTLNGKPVEVIYNVRIDFRDGGVAP